MHDTTRHSRSYHKFFEDWAEWKTVDKNGKIHVERVYVGNYYRSPLNKRQRLIRRIQYVLLYVLSVAAFIMSGSKDVPVNHAIVPALASAVCIFAFALLFLSLCSNLISPEEMIIRQYRASSLDLIQMSGITAIALAAAAFINILFLITVNDTSVMETIFCIVGYLAAAGFTLILHFLERCLDYKIMAPRISCPENSIVIQFESAEQRF